MLNQLLTLFIVMLLSQPVWAVGFGKASLHSHLGEPLDVRIPLLLEKAEKIGQLSINLATPREYKNLEQAVPKSYHVIRVNVSTSESQVPEVHLTSASAIDEAILVLVLKVKRGRGVFYKKMQFFLDATDIKPMKKTSWVNAPSRQIQYTPPLNKTTKKKPVSQLMQPSTRFAGDWARRSSYGPVQYGDSLSEIAYRLRKDKRWSNRQVMLALFDANPSAFNNSNINQLKKGSFLKVPDNAAVQTFVSSQRYQDLKSLALRSPAKKKTAIKLKKEPLQVSTQDAADVAPVFKGKISLGLQENLGIPPIHPQVLQRLDKLEPMYQQAMTTGLRLDGMDGKVDALAEEVDLLHDKIDALARSRVGVVEEKTHYGWFGFFALLLANIVLLTAYFYRKQMKDWQNKLMEAQRHTMPVNNNTAEQPLFDPMQDDMPKPRAEESVQHESNDINTGDSVPMPDLVAVDEKLSSAEQKMIDYAANFEEMVHKKDWQQAEKYYELMDDKARERPRMQALWVQKLHGSNNVMERNITLLNLSRVYEYDQWHRFCSYFDQDVWHELQDEKVISYTGKVVEPEMDKMNQQLMAVEGGMDEAAPVLDLSETGRFDITVQDFQAVQEGNDDPMQDTWDEKNIEDDSIVDMGTVDDAEIEPIADIISGDEDDGLPEGTNSALKLDFDFELEQEEEVTNGDDDTVFMTPEMLEEMNAKRDKDSGG